MLPVLCHLKPQIFINKGSAVSVLLQSLAASFGKWIAFKMQSTLESLKVFMEIGRLKFF